MKLAEYFAKGKVLLVTDLHLRDADFKTIKGYVKATERVLLDIIAFCKEHGITHVIFLGDVFDKGYRYHSMSHSHRNMFEELRDLLNGNLYTVVGNHFFLERDSNPLMYLMQPNPRYSPREEFYATKPVIKVIDELQVGCKQFSFFHFDKEEKLYVREKDPTVLYHHGLYHDDYVIPRSIRVDNYIHRVTTSEYLQTVFANIDMATVGHLHVPIGNVDIKVAGKTIPMDIPGSLCIVADDDSKKHKSIMLPVYDINEKSFTKSMHEFKLHFNELKFSKIKQDPLPDELLPKDTKVRRTSEVLQHNINGHLTLRDWLAANGETDLNIRMIMEASKEPLSIQRAVAYAFGNEEVLNK